MLAQPAKHGQMQLVPHARGLPVTQATPARHAATKPKFPWQVLPWNTRLQDVQDAIQRRAVTDRTTATAFGRWHEYRNQRFQRAPQFVAYFSSGHAARIWLPSADVQVVLAALKLRHVPLTNTVRAACSSALAGIGPCLWSASPLYIFKVELSDFIIL
jgi:hypothetical protein